MSNVLEEKYLATSHLRISISVTESAGLELNVVTEQLPAGKAKEVAQATKECLWICDSWNPSLFVQAKSTECLQVHQAGVDPLHCSNPAHFPQQTLF